MSFPNRAEVSPSRRKRRSTSKSESRLLKEPKVELLDFADAENDDFDGPAVDKEEYDDPSWWVKGRGSSKVWEFFDRHAFNELAKCRLCNVKLRRKFVLFYEFTVKWRGF